MMCNIPMESVWQCYQNRESGCPPVFVFVQLSSERDYCFFLFGIDELSMQLEEPFSILPMQVFCDELLEANKILVGKDEPCSDT